MATIHTTQSSRVFDGIAAACRGLASEVATLVPALLRPGRIIDEVERMRALLAEADRVAASDPARAAALRRRASRTCIR